MQAGERPTVFLIKVPSYSDVISPPLGIGYLAAHLRGLANIHFFDGVRDRLSPEHLGSLVRRHQPQVVAFSLVTYATENALALMKAARQAWPAAVLVAGGPHPSALPEEFLQAAGSDLDGVITGEAEGSMKRLVELLPQRPQEVAAEIPGFAFLGPNGYQHTPALEPREIDELGIPAWEFMPPATYPDCPHGAFFRKLPVAPLITSRGCPYSCGFCSVPFIVGRRIRYRSPESVTDELTLLRRDYGIKEFQIVDDNFTIAKKKAIAICEEILRKNLVMPWTLPNGVRIDALDDEMLDAMQAAGCYSVSLGIESGSKRVLERMVKHLDLSIVPGVIDRIVSRGMEAHAFFMLGYPGEEPEEALQTIAFAKSLKLTRANFSLFTPLPGTPEYDTLSRQEKDRILRNGFYGTVNYVSPHYTEGALKNLQRKAILEFYGRLTQGVRLVKAIRTPQNAYFVLRRAVHWLGA